MRRELRCSLPFLFEELGCSEEEKEEEEEGLFKPKAVNEEDPERDRATPALKVWTRGGVGGGAGHQSLNCVG